MNPLGPMDERNREKGREGSSLCARCRKPFKWIIFGEFDTAGLFCKDCRTTKDMVDDALMEASGITTRKQAQRISEQAMYKTPPDVIENLKKENAELRSKIDMVQGFLSRLGAPLGINADPADNLWAFLVQHVTDGKPMPTREQIEWSYRDTQKHNKRKDPK